MHLNNDPKFLLDEHKRRVAQSDVRAQQLAAICRQPLWLIRQLSAVVDRFRPAVERAGESRWYEQASPVDCHRPGLALCSPVHLDGGPLKQG